jgi:hypothetical protein
MYYHAHLMLRQSAILVIAALAIASPAAVAARVVILHNDHLRPFWLGDPQSRQELADLIQQMGHEVVESTDVAEWPLLLDSRHTSIVIYGPAENVPENLVEPVWNYLDSGGKIITGGGMAFFNVVAPNQGYPVLRNRMTQQVLRVRHVLLARDGDAAITALGEQILGTEAAEQPARFIRGLAAVPGQTPVVVPLLNKSTEAVVCFVHFPNNGRLFFYGSVEPVQHSLLDPHSVAGRQRWGRIIGSIMQPRTELGEIESRRTFIIGQDTLVDVKLKVANPSDQPLTVAGELIMFSAAGEVRHRQSMTLELAPREQGTRRAELPLPELAHEWGFFPVEFHADGGLSTRTVLHVVPPAIAAYLDVDRIFDATGEGDLTLRFGLQRFADAPVEVTWLLEQADSVRPASGEPLQFTQIEQQPARLVQAGVSRFQVGLPMPPGDRLFRLTLLIDGTAVNHEYIRFEAGPRPALERPPIIGRSLNGHQFYTEPDLVDRMKALREHLPLVGEFSVARWEPPMLEAARSAGFDYMGQMHLIGPDGRNWNVRDLGPNGEDPYRGHGLLHQGEDKTLWMTQQLSRRYVDRAAVAGVDRMLFIEPGTTFSTAPMGRYGPWFGYTPEAVDAFRLALQGLDSGVRLLEPGGKRITRVHFADMWRMINDAPVPQPQQLGFSSWDEYEPYRIPTRNRAGDFRTERELLAMKLHLTLRMYYNVWQIDQITTYARTLVPEVQVVLNTDGPRNGQYSPFLYRLPFIDTHQKQMFNSAYQWGAPTYFGGEPIWWMRTRMYGKRMRLRDEIGHGGNAVPYRTPETSFVAVFTKRAAMPGEDYEIHHYNLGHATIRVREEMAMWSGFSMASDLGAKRHWEGQRDLLLLTINPGHYPELYRPFALSGRQLGAAEALRRAGVEYDAVELPFPVAPWHHLDNYRTIVLDAAAQGGGTFEALRAWLDQTSLRQRTLVLNNIHFLHITTAGGAAPQTLRVLKPTRWRDLGLPQQDYRVESHSRLSIPGEQPFIAPQPIPVFLVPPPPGAQVLVGGERDEPVVWRFGLPNGNAIIYSGLPVNLVGEEQDPRTITERLWVSLFTGRLGYPTRITCSVPETFAGLYRTEQGMLMLALISHHEAKMITRVNYASEEALFAAAAAIPEQEVTVTIRGMTPHAKWRLFDVVSGTCFGEAEVDAEGTVRLTSPLHLVKLIALAPHDADEAELRASSAEYTELWK